MCLPIRRRLNFQIVSLSRNANVAVVVVVAAAFFPRKEDCSSGRRLLLLLLLPEDTKQQQACYSFGGLRRTGYTAAAVAGLSRRSARGDGDDRSGFGGG